jgi:DDE superfamily endonuclease
MASINDICRGMRVEYLPTYSPNFNLIKQAFSVMKNYIQRHYHQFVWCGATGTDPEDDADIYAMLHKAIYYINAEHATGFFAHSGYM